LYLARQKLARRFAAQLFSFSFFYDFAFAPFMQHDSRAKQESLLKLWQKQFLSFDFF